ncbi:MAG: pgaC [Ramlibacter sp.]|nr:pgaC [Ramlibacter sp.]
MNGVSGADLQHVVFAYVFYYPFLMAWIWITGGVLHALVFERGAKAAADPLAQLPATPLVSVIVPCRNEAAQVHEVIAQLMRSNYPDFEVIAVNDGSTDATGAILDALTLEWPRLRVVHLATNQGKAVALNTAVLVARGEFIFGIDGDALIDPDAIGWLMVSMLRSDRVAAVTGNPRIRNRTTLLGRMQVGEFSSTIGLIKRTQQIVGRLFTVSGVVVMFRRKALMEVGFWSNDVLTEDIDVSWKLQVAGWGLRFEPRALAWVLMPETLRGLYRQRQRWATGGIQTALRYTPHVLHPRQWRMWPIAFEYLASVVWAYAMLLVIVLALLGRWLPPSWQVGFVPQWHGTVLGMTCMAQMFASMCIDRHYDHRLLRYFAWTVWYPLAFWMLNMVTSVIGVPAALLRPPGRRARWRSPDRGLTNVR